MSYRYEATIIQLIDQSLRTLTTRPLILGGVAGSGGGTGGPPGGFSGWLPQSRVAFDYSELEDDTIPTTSATLVHNLNRIRHRLADLEAAGPGGSGAAYFTDLNDVPASYTGFGGYVVAVNEAETALEFIVGGGGSPAGNDKEIQYNNGGAFGASGKFLWNNTTQYLTLSGTGNVYLEGAGGASLKLETRDAFDAPGYIYLNAADSTDTNTSNFDAWGGDIYLNGGNGIRGGGWIGIYAGDAVTGGNYGGGVLQLYGGDGKGSGAGGAVNIAGGTGGMTGTGGNVTINPGSGSTDGWVLIGRLQIGDGGYSNYAQFAADGELNLVGTARVKKEIRIEAVAAKRGSSAPTETTRAVGASGTVLMPVISFSDTVQQDVYFIIHAPTDLDATATSRFHVMWQPGASWTSGNYFWKLEYLIMNENGATLLSGTPTTIPAAAITPANATTNIETEMSNSISLGLEQMMVCHFYRDVANDTGNDVGQVSYFELEYTANKLGEAT